MYAKLSACASAPPRGNRLVNGWGRWCPHPSSRHDSTTGSIAGTFVPAFTLPTCSQSAMQAELEYRLTIGLSVLPPICLGLLPTRSCVCTGTVVSSASSYDAFTGISISPKWHGLFAATEPKPRRSRGTSPKTRDRWESRGSDSTLLRYRRHLRPDNGDLPDGWCRPGRSFESSVRARPSRFSPPDGRFAVRVSSSASCQTRAAREGTYCFPGI